MPSQAYEGLSKEPQTEDGLPNPGVFWMVKPISVIVSLPLSYAMTASLPPSPDMAAFAGASPCESSCMCIAPLTAAFQHGQPSVAGPAALAAAAHTRMPPKDRPQSSRMHSHQSMWLAAHGMISHCVCFGHKNICVKFHVQGTFAVGGRLNVFLDEATYAPNLDIELYHYPMAGDTEGL